MSLTAEETDQKTNSISQSQIDSLNMPNINSQLPLKFESGYVLKGFCGYCSICNNPIKAKDMHGSIHQPFPSVAIIEAIGLCRSCKIAVPFLMRVRANGTTDWKDSNGNWIEGAAENESYAISPAQQKLLGLVMLTLLFAVILSANG